MEPMNPVSWIICEISDMSFGKILALDLKYSDVVSFGVDVVFVPSDDVLILNDGFGCLLKLLNFE